MRRANRAMMLMEAPGSGADSRFAYPEEGYIGSTGDYSPFQKEESLQPEDVSSSMSPALKTSLLKGGVALIGNAQKAAEARRARARQYAMWQRGKAMEGAAGEAQEIQRGHERVMRLISQAYS